MRALEPSCGADCLAEDTAARETGEREHLTAPQHTRRVKMGEITFPPAVKVLIQLAAVAAFTVA